MSVWAGIGRGTVVAVLGCVVLTSPGHGAQRCDQWAARLESAQGSVEVQFAGTTQWNAASQGDVFCEGDTITLGKASRAALRLPNETVLRLDELSSLRLTAVKREEESLLDMLKGAIHFLSRVPRSLKVQTPFVNAAIEGTEFLVRVDVALAEITVFEGVVAATNELGSMRARAGEGIEARRGEAPRQVTVVAPLDAVQWALYYPPVFDPAELERRRAGQPDQAQQREIDEYLYSAARHLYVGRVGEAEAALTELAKLAPDNADALALRAVVAVARNENEQAVTLAKQATEQAPDSAAARIALSYARQAQFDLPAATDAARKAIELSPDNALAHARLAELLLSQGELNAALSSAQSAVELNPELGRTQTILGFAYLTRIETREAQSAFARAIELAPADPLPRLGLGLARIRRGALAEGREHIETAASLDPNNALVRSYLGKAYYEEKRNPLAAVQYDLAKGLDPRDPTPWFYDAIRKQTENRPVEALKDMNESIAINDNRAVFRSRLQLDQDEAARSASAARIYRDLGFQQRALVEGWSSLNADPASHSAHRFLADSYSALPRHEIARVSELLQSQLLQPLNITPIQPQLAEADLLIAPGSGPSQTALNEYNPMFTRNGMRALFNGVLGSNNTLGNDLVVSGIYDWFSFSLGQYHYETDGFYENSGLEQDIYNAFAQAQMGPRSSIQFELRRNERTNGDLAILFDPELLSRDATTTREEDSARVGYHFKPTAASDLLFSYVQTDETEDFEGSQIIGSTPEGDVVWEITDTFDRHASTPELQYRSNRRGYRYVAGFGYSTVDTERYRRIVELFPGSPPGVIEVPDEIAIENGNAHLYVSFDAHPTVEVTLGISADSYSDERRSSSFEQDQVNPKLGVLWRVRPSTIVRAAGFRVLKRPMISNQTLEPTQVAGFNQFFDDDAGTDSIRYGIGLDHTFSASMWGGMEVSARDLERPEINEVVRQTQEERAARAYLYWTPTSNTSLSADFFYEDFARDPPTRNVRVPNELTTWWLPLTARYFLANGLFGSLRGTYVEQALVDQTYEERNETFWIFDLSLGYRLPKRLGSVRVDVQNLFDEEFSFYGLDFQSGSVPKRLFSPERAVYAKVEFAF